MLFPSQVQDLNLFGDLNDWKIADSSPAVNDQYHLQDERSAARRMTHLFTLVERTSTYRTFTTRPRDLARSTAASFGDWIV